MARRLAKRLTAVVVQAAKPSPEKTKILADGDGLRLLIHSNGSRYWQLRAKLGGREKTIQLGQYPEMGLAEARDAAEAARKKLAEGRDPILERRVSKATRLAASQNSFEAVADAMLGVKTHNASAGYVDKIRGAFKANLYPSIGKMPIQEITPPILREALRRIEARGSLDMLANVRRWAGEVFDYAKAEGVFAGDNPAHCLVKNIFKQHKRDKMQALPWKEMPAFLRRLDESRGTEAATLIAVRLLVLTACRPGEVRQARWEEFDLDNAKWTIPASRMKARKEHWVPLSTQAVKALKGLQTLTGYSPFLFPSRAGAKAETLSDMALLKAVRRIAGHDKVDAHGFRAVFRTHAEESGKWEFEVMEAALAHGKKSSVVASYARATHYEKRVKLMQWWADTLDALKDEKPKQLKAA